MYATTGRNAPSKTKAIIVSDIEMTTPRGERQWYRRAPLGVNNRMQDFVLGDDEEDEMMPR